MAITGIVFVGFLFAHLAGNLLIFRGPTAINTYAAKLRELGPLLWFLRLGLLASVVLHVKAALALTLRNRSAKPVKYVKVHQVRSTFASRTMMLTGLVILAFVFYHLAHLTFRLTHSAEFAGLGDFDVYQMMVLSFRSPLVSLFYMVAIVLLVLHLNHGLVSLFQTLGIHSSVVNPIIRIVCPTISVILGVGFLSIPISIFMGWVA